MFSLSRDMVITHIVFNQYQSSMSHKSMYYSDKSYVMHGYNDDNGRMSNFASILKYHLSTS